MSSETFALQCGINIPSEILSAIENDSLVLFVGAGASYGEPSNLPLFNELVREICKITCHPELSPPEEGQDGAQKDEKTSGCKESYDSILGRINDDMGVEAKKVHKEIYEILSKAKHVNETHRAIVRLAFTTRTFRVVTTNQDCLLESDELYPTNNKPRIYDAPALPQGDEFQGLVNLHGSIRNHKEMIFTDRDFGKAYLTKQYCSKFLSELFTCFTVLFIGFGYDDPVMKYHSRGLGVCKRYVITDKPEKESWKILGITPIKYETGKREKVTCAINELAQHFSLKYDEKRELMKLIAQKDPSQLSAYEHSLLAGTLFSDKSDDLNLIVWFFNNTNDYHWCKYFEENEKLAGQMFFNRYLSTKTMTVRPQ